MAISDMQENQLDISGQDGLPQDADLTEPAAVITPMDKPLRYPLARLFIASLIIRIAAFFIRLRERLLQ